MTLLVFSYLLAVFLFVFSYYLDSRPDRDNTLFTSMTMTSAFFSLFVAIAVHLLYATDSGLGLFILKVSLSLAAFSFMLLLRYCFTIPYNSRTVVLDILSWILLVFGVYLVFSSLSSFSWTLSGGFKIVSRSFRGLADGLWLFAVVYLVGIPALSVLSLLFRALRIKSRIYRQRLLLVAASVCVGLGISVLLFFFSLRYSWALPLVPFGVAVMLVMINQAVSVTTLYDRSLVAATVTKFTLLGVFVSALTAFLTALSVELIERPPVLFLVIAAIAFVMLGLREFFTKRLQRYIRMGNEYEEDLEAALDQIDYNGGGEKVIAQTVALLETHVESSSVVILVSDDKGKLVTTYSTSGEKNELALENKGIDFLLNNNESIVVKTQAIANHNYAEVKPELLKIFDIGHSDALILLREGHRVIGMILLGPKKRGSDYTEYDYSILSKLYSNFFLVMYYLKNIANESVVLTVDRELEFSGQIITSIQENIDRINHPKMDVDFITQSARKLGGDFIDFIKLGEDKYLYVMGDVSGKGLNASMSMVILKSVLRTFLSETTDFKQLVIKVNLFIKNNLPKGTFFAGLFGLIDFGTNTMYYLNCGVPTMFLYTATYNNAIEIQGDGKVLGFVRDIGKYLKVKKILLNPQDIILMTTDGMVDSTNLRGERFGKDRIQRMLMDNRTYPAGRIAKFLCDSLGEFVSREMEDDITVLVFKYLSR